MVNFLPNLINIIKEDAALANNVMLKAVVENMQLKLNSFTSEYDMNSNLKLQLEGFNAYAGDEKIASFIQKIDEELSREKKDNINLSIPSLYDEVNITSMMESIVNSEAYKEASVKTYIDSLYESINTTSMPKFRYLPGFVNSLQNMMHHSTVNEAVTTVQNYMHNNYPKLVLMEAIHYLDTTANGFYRNIANKLKTHLVNEQYSADAIAMDLGSMSEMSVVKNMLGALRTIEGNKAEANGFSIGSGSGDVKIYNYIGPVLKEGNNLTAYVGNMFVHITPEVVDPSNYNRIVENAGGITIAEYNTKYVFENHREFHDLALSFAALGFRNSGSTITSKLRNLKVDFKINEGMNLDLYINDNKINDPKQVNMANLFVMESELHKNCALNVFEHFDNLYNVEFMKFIVNESTGNHALVINVKDSFVVYNKVSESSVEIKKMDKFQFVKFIGETFKYDISDYYKIDYNETVSKIKLIEHKKTQVNDSITKLEESIIKIDQTLAKDINEKDRADLISLKEEVEAEIIKLKDAYILLENDKVSAMQPEEAQSTQEEPKEGDDVEVLENGIIGKVIQKSGDIYTIFGTDNKIMSLKRDQFELKSGDAGSAITEEVSADNIPKDENTVSDGSTETAQAEQTGTENTEAAKTETETPAE